MMADSVGTAGVSKALKQHDPSIRVILVDPPGSSLYNKVQLLCAVSHIIFRRRIYSSFAEICVSQIEWMTITDLKPPASFAWQPADGIRLSPSCGLDETLYSESYHSGGRLQLQLSSSASAFGFSSRLRTILQRLFRLAACAAISIVGKCTAESTVFHGNALLSTSGR